MKSSAALKMTFFSITEQPHTIRAVTSACECTASAGKHYTLMHWHGHHPPPQEGQRSTVKTTSALNTATPACSGRNVPAQHVLISPHVESSRIDHPRIARNQVASRQLNDVPRHHSLQADAADGATPAHLQPSTWSCQTGPACCSPPWAAEAAPPLWRVLQCRGSSKAELA